MLAYQTKQQQQVTACLSSMKDVLFAHIHRAGVSCSWMIVYRRQMHHSQMLTVPSKTLQSRLSAEINMIQHVHDQCHTLLLSKCCLSAGHPSQGACVDTVQPSSMPGQQQRAHPATGPACLVLQSPDLGSELTFLLSTSCHPKHQLMSPVQQACSRGLEICSNSLQVQVHDWCLGSSADSSVE